MANHPFSWPGSAFFVPKGTSTAVNIKPSYSYTTSDVQRLTPADRQCLYPVNMTFNNAHCNSSVYYLSVLILQN